MLPSRKSRVGAAVAVAILCGLIVWFETHHKIAGFRAWTFACVFLIIAIVTGATRGGARNALLILATTAFGLTTLEVAANLLQRQGNGTDLQVSPFWITLKPEVGFGFVQAGEVHARKRNLATGATIFEADYTIGDSLDRQVRSAATGPATVFFGDSYTFGEGVNDADTMPQRYADLVPGQRVLNLAITGYSPQQFLREVEIGLRDDVIGPKPTAFLFLTSSFHAMRTACKETWVTRAPRYEFVDGRPAYQGRCYQGARLAGREFLENTALYRLAIRPYSMRLRRTDVDLYISILAQAVRISKERYGVPTLVPYVRAAPDYLAGTGYDEDAVIAAMRAQGIWVVDMSLPDDREKGKVYSIPGDGHPTPAANVIRARLIADALKAGPGQAGGAAASASQ